ncbi:MAG: hypothetical protein RJA44_280 [Pseudomonadota bacterium]
MSTAPTNTAALDASHDPALRSWVESAQAEGCDFPIQNLPCARLRRAGSAEPWRIGVAIGAEALDLAAAAALPLWSAEVATWLAPLAAGDLNAFMALGRPAWRGVRAALSAALSAGSEHQAALTPCLIAQAELEYSLPCRIGDYTDFYTGVHHATTVGKLFRPDNPLLPNYHWVPIGYHGRSSSIGVSGQQIRRPQGQFKAPDAEVPSFGPCRRLDHELELGLLIGPGNAQGTSIGIEQAEEQLFGVVLLNDWSARDMQAWEYQPLGPFLAKNFATTISPWVVSIEALAPSRVPLQRPAEAPAPLPYLDSAFNRSHGAFDVELEVWLQTAAMRAAGEPAVRLSHSNWSQAACWSAAQLVTHHSVGGCNLQPGDLLGTGTLSGPTPDQGGSLLELSNGGKQPLTLPNGEQRSFLQDGDCVILRGHAGRPGTARIGFGACAGTVLPSA